MRIDSYTHSWLSRDLSGCAQTPNQKKSCNVNELREVSGCFWTLVDVSGRCRTVKWWRAGLPKSLRNYMILKNILFLQFHCCPQSCPRHTSVSNFTFAANTPSIAYVPPGYPLLCGNSPGIQSAADAVSGNTQSPGVGSETMPS